MKNLNLVRTSTPPVNTGAGEKSAAILAPSSPRETESTTSTPSPTYARYPSTAGSRSGGGFNIEGIPDKIKQIEYAVRGPILARAKELERDIENQPFDRIIPCNIGNPMALGMKPLSYIRETIALVTCPQLLETDESELQKHFAIDNIQRAKRYLGYLRNAGAYTESLGASGLRGEIADFLGRRDGTRPSPDSIMITNGASEAINTLLSCLIGGERDGVLTPIPQYPLYSAAITRLGGQVLGYELDEDNNWSLDVQTIRASYDDATARGFVVKAIVVICPGNPAPCFLTRQQVVEILTFAAEKDLLVIADEVYQENCYYPEKPFFPFRRVLMEEPSLHTQLASLHSSSKGVYGECGLRGGFCQIENIGDECRAILVKMRSVELCSNTIGQLAITCVCNPPMPGDASYETYMTERTRTFNELKEKAIIVADFFNSLPGVSCQPILGAMYAFPRIDFSNAAKEEAARQGRSVEMMYCMELLEHTGFVTSNGDGFGQRQGTHHIRFAILPSKEMLSSGLERYRKFHIDFMNRFASA